MFQFIRLNFNEIIISLFLTIIIELNILFIFIFIIATSHNLRVIKSFFIIIL